MSKVSGIEIINEIMECLSLEYLDKDDYEKINQFVVNNLQAIANKHGVKISKDWENHCRLAALIDGNSGMAKTYHACCYAITSAINDSNGKEQLDLDILPLPDLDI